MDEADLARLRGDKQGYREHILRAARIQEQVLRTLQERVPNRLQTCGITRYSAAWCYVHADHRWDALRLAVPGLWYRGPDQKFIRLRCRQAVWGALGL